MSKNELTDTRSMRASQAANSALTWQPSATSIFVTLSACSSSSTWRAVWRTRALGCQPSRPAQVDHGRWARSAAPEASANNRRSLSAFEIVVPMLLSCFINLLLPAHTSPSTLAGGNAAYIFETLRAHQHRANTEERSGLSPLHTVCACSSLG